MKVQRKINGNTLVEAEAPNVMALFEQLSTLEEIFNPGKCGICNGTHIGFRTREVGGIKFHEAWCIACGAAFAYGTRKVGGALFPQRKDAEGNVKQNNGWARWTPTNGD